MRIPAVLTALIGALFAAQAQAGEAFEVTVLRGGNIAVVSGDEHGEIRERVVRESPEPPPAPPEPEPEEEPEAAPVVVKVVQPVASHGWPVVYFSGGRGRPDHDHRHGFDRRGRYERGIVPRNRAREIDGHGSARRGFGRGFMAGPGAHGLGRYRSGHGRR